MTAKLVLESEKSKAKKKMKIFVISLAAVLALTGCAHDGENDGESPAETSRDVMQLYRSTVSGSKYIMHALGGDAGNTYINSVEVLAHWYERGMRPYEADVWETSDGRLVLTHRSSNMDGTLSDNDKKRLGYTGGGIPTFEEFMKFKVHGTYPTSSFKELVDFMAEHDDMFVKPDINQRLYDDTRRLYQKMYDDAGGNTDVLDRIIANGWSSDMISAIRDVYDFKILNMYWNTKSKREFEEAEEFIEFCKRNGVSAFSTAKEFVKEDSQSVKALVDSGLIGYVYTINDSAEYEVFMSEYPFIDCVGTDLLGADMMTGL